MGDEWVKDMTEQLQSKKGLTRDQAEKAVTLYKSEYIGQNSHALWQWAIEEACE
jgi:hypothetical protein